MTVLVPFSGCGVVAKQQNAAGVQMYQQGAFDASIQKFQKAMWDSATAMVKKDGR